VSKKHAAELNRLHAEYYRRRKDERKLAEQMRNEIWRLQREHDALCAQLKGCDHVPYLDRMKELVEKNERLQQWKDKAIEILMQWDAIAELFATSKDLGKSKVVIVAEEIKRLRAMIVHCDKCGSSWVQDDCTDGCSCEKMRQLERWAAFLRYCALSGEVPMYDTRDEFEAAEAKEKSDG